jgi:hypothetical protein
VNSLFDKTKHLEEDRWIHPADGAILAANQMRWLIKWVNKCASYCRATWALLSIGQGDIIQEGRIVEYARSTYLEAKFDERDGRMVENLDFGGDLYYCDDRSPPSRFSPCKPYLLQAIF